MKRLIEVTQTVLVEVPDALFTPEFMAEFQRSFYEFTTAADHLRHLAQLHARGIVDDESSIEGYGPARKVGIKFEVLNVMMEMMEGDSQ